MNFWHIKKQKNNFVDDTENNSSVKSSKSSSETNKQNFLKKVFGWILKIAVPALLIGLSIWSCIPKFKTIKPVSACLESSNNGTSVLKISDENNKEYKYIYSINDKIETNAFCYFTYVIGSGDSISYKCHLRPKNFREIEFDMTIYSNNDGKKTAIYIGGNNLITKEDPNLGDPNFLKWVNYVVNNAQKQPKTFFSIGYVISNLFSAVFYYLFITYLLSRISKKTGGNVFGFSKSQSFLVKTNVKFSDIAGIEEEKAELVEVVDYLKNSKKYVAMGARVPKGVILYGPPGTGKTLLAKAVAGEANVPFFQISGSSFEDTFVGVGAKRVRNLFADARKSSPSIIFIDEIDSVASKRGQFVGASGVIDQTINQLLAEMDGFSTKTGVIVMAATNRLDTLDDAILRPGRFDRQIQVNLPDIKEREAILKIHAKNKNLSNKVVLNDIARRTPGFSGAELENVLNEATLLAVRKNKTTITTQDIDEAIDRVLAGPAKHTKVISEEEKKQIAIHEAGHAIVGLYTKNGDVVEKITIIPRGNAAGYMLLAPEKQEISIKKKSYLLAIVRTTLGGRAAEYIEYGKESVSTGAANDLFKVTSIVKSMVTQLGMSDVGMTQFVPTEKNILPYNQQKFYSDATSVKIDNEIEKIIQNEFHQAIKIIKDNKKELALIVEALLLLETIVKDQIDYIHKNHALPPEAIEKKESLKNKNS